MTRLRTILAALAAASLDAGPGMAGADQPTPTDHALFATIWLQPGLGLLQPETPALLMLPAGWVAGDAVVVLAPAATGEAGARDRLVSALLQAGSGVLEISRHRPHAVEADFTTALDAVKRDLGAGIVAALGGPDAGPALAAAEAARTSGSERYAAVVVLDARAPRIRFAAAPAAEDWPSRAPLFCTLLASALPAARDGLALACRDGLALLR